jgi:hypothetical protein
MNETLHIPRFRSAKRLVAWMERNWYSLPDHRLPPDRERVFLKTKKEEPREVAACVSRYAVWAGRLPEYEGLLVGHNDSVLLYLRSVRSKGGEVNQALLDSLAGDSRSLYRWAKDVGRLPEHLEDTMTEPRFLFLYAKEVLRGRLPSHLEAGFFGDSYHLGRYAFDIIRGFAPVRLPEELHNCMVMKSFEEPDNDHIRAYMEACESDPNVVGNSDSKVR